MAEIAEAAVEAFTAETGTTPVVNVSDVDASTVTTESAPTQSDRNRQFYSEADLAKVRTQEKDKLYPVIEKLKEEVEALRKEKEAEVAQRQAEETEKLTAIEARKKAEEEASLDIRDLLAKKDSEWQEQLERERNERERAFALLEQERAFADLQTYKSERLDAERDNIMPELLDLIQGNTREELDSSIEGLKDRSARILESAQSAMQNTRREMTGTRATLPPAGPLETNMESRQFTAQEIAAMSVKEYGQYRDRLLSEKARGRNPGLIG
jgi:hypothetical protein